MAKPENGFAYERITREALEKQLRFLLAQLGLEDRGQNSAKTNQVGKKPKQVPEF